MTTRLLIGLALSAAFALAVYAMLFWGAVSA